MQKKPREARRGAYKPFLGNLRALSFIRIVALNSQEAEPNGRYSLELWQVQPVHGHR